MSTTYENQKLRGLKKRVELVEYMGGKCSICGYDKSVSALEFHHLKPEEKSYSLDMRTMSSKNIEDLKKEADKCILVCSNCHREIHYPHLNKENINETINGVFKEVMEKKAPQKKTKYICEYCGKPFKAVTRKKFCCHECRMKSLNYPSYEEIKEKYKEVKSWTKVAEFYSLGRNVIRLIRRKAGEKC